MIKATADIKTIAPLFWEYDFSSFDLVKNEDFIIERVIEKGRVEHLVSLFKIFPKIDIYKSVKENSNISLSKKNFWLIMVKNAIISKNYQWR